jgi:hypothetical protein
MSHLLGHVSAWCCRRQAAGSAATDRLRAAAVRYHDTEAAAARRRVSTTRARPRTPMGLNIFGRLMPREEAFTQLFCDQTRCIVQGAHELLDMVDGKGPVDAHVAAIRHIEGEADGVARKVFLAANRTFNAPIDREDIIDLANRLDDAVDLIEDTAKAIQRYALTEFPGEMRAIADAAARSADVLHKVMPLLDEITPQHKTIFELCEEVGHIEEEADQCFDTGLALLRAQLRAGQVDTVGYMDRKEIYELLEDVVDRCDDIANEVQAITAKHV